MSPSKPLIHVHDCAMYPYVRGIYEEITVNTVDLVFRELLYTIVSNIHDPYRSQTFAYNYYWTHNSPQSSPLTYDHLNTRYTSLLFTYSDIRTSAKVKKSDRQQWSFIFTQIVSP